jgi:predicted nucleotidyltransferase
MREIALSVPPISIRERVPFTAIENVVEQIVLRFHPIRIILFGSYAYGNPCPESDVDLFVVMETPISEVRQAVEILTATSYRFGLDLLVYTPRRLAQRMEWGDPFVQEIVTRGKVLYESAGS